MLHSGLIYKGSPFTAIEGAKSVTQSNPSSDQTPDFPEIVSVKQLVQVLKETPTEYFSELAEHINLPASDVVPCATWSRSHHTRVCIERNERFELMLICWEPGQKTDIHDHNSEECWMYFVDGKFEEAIYDYELKSTAPRQINTTLAGDVAYMVDFIGIHSLENISANRGMSLHLYAKPITSCNVLNWHSKSFVRKNLRYDSVATISANCDT
jgi:cysteine dioxygenase